MNAKSPNMVNAWHDPDDAPELTGEEIDQENAVWRVGGHIVSSEQGRAAFWSELRNQVILDALDADVAEWIRRHAPGHDYPSFVNRALREAIQRQSDTADTTGVATRP